MCVCQWFRRDSQFCSFGIPIILATLFSRVSVCFRIISVQTVLRSFYNDVTFPGFVLETVSGCGDGEAQEWR